MKITALLHILDEMPQEQIAVLKSRLDEIFEEMGDIEVDYAFFEDDEPFIGVSHEEYLAIIETPDKGEMH